MRTIAQEQEAPVWDSSYLEDQFYVGLTYNFLLDIPEDITQQNFSYGLQTGFIKDIPINASRTNAIGIGLGYAVNSYYTNLRATETADGIQYSVLNNDVSFRRNKVETHLIEMPIELRWRNSNVTSHRFWRVYTGVKLSYVVGGRSKFVTNEFKDSFYNTDIRSFQYGITLNFGYNTFNIHTYYALNNLFNDGISITDGDTIGLRPLRIGVIFYIL